MNVHYNAFISYRHCPRDSAVAALVQQQLEHFHIPKAIQKKSGMRRISRIFRDKEELPITSNLNDDIAQALENSDFLIVICSPQTSESLWVQREIECFLSTHTRKQVLTVLSAGEPEQIIPEILRFDEVSDPETGEMRRIPVEPLSCDYRLPKRTARRVELPRLAASLLGCGYDELRQRQRQYRLRRLTAALGAVLCLSLLLTAYFIRTSLMIQENYQEVLRSQSRYLAAESLELLEDGDRLNAILLALQALPGDGGDRPLMHEAEFALGSALQIYTPVADGALTDYWALASLPVSGTPTEFFLNEDGSRLVVQNDLYQVSVWDTATYQCLWSHSAGDFIYDMFLAKDRYLVVDTSWNGALCYDLESGEQLWRMEDYYSDIGALPDGRGLLMLNSSDLSLTILDPATGAATGQWTIDPPEEEPFGESPSLSLAPDDWCREGDSRVVLQLSCSLDVESFYSFAIFDLDTGSVVYAPEHFSFLKQVLLGENGLLYIMGYQNDLWTSSQIVASYTSLMEDLMTVCCVDTKTGETNWTSQLPFWQVDLADAAMQVRDGKLLCVFSNICTQLDCATGEELLRCETTTPIIYNFFGESRTLMVLRDGSIGRYIYETNECVMFPVFAGQVNNVAMGNNQFFVQSVSGPIICYGISYDETWNPIPEGIIGSPAQTVVTGDLVLIYCYDRCLYAYDKAEQALRWSAELEFSSPSILGISEEDNAVFLAPSYGAEILALDLNTGEPLLSEDLSYNAIALWGDTLALGTTDYAEGTAVLTLTPLNGDPAHSITIPSGSEFSPRIAGIYPGADSALIAFQDGGGYLVNRTDGQVTGLAEPIQSDYDGCISAWSQDGSYLTAVGPEQIWIWNADGTLKAELPMAAEQVVSLCFTPDNQNLLVLMDDTFIYRYDLDGTFLSQTEIYCYSITSYSRVRWQFTDAEELILYVDWVANLVDTTTWTLPWYANWCTAYLPEQDALLCCTEAEDGYQLGLFHRYSTEELVAKGREAVGGLTLSDEMRARYGIN